MGGWGEGGGVSGPAMPSLSINRTEDYIKSALPQ